MNLQQTWHNKGAGLYGQSNFSIRQIPLGCLMQTTANRQMWTAPIGGYHAVVCVWLCVVQALSLGRDVGWVC